MMKLAQTHIAKALRYQKSWYDRSTCVLTLARKCWWCCRVKGANYWRNGRVHLRSSGSLDPPLMKLPHQAWTSLVKYCLRSGFLILRKSHKSWWFKRWWRKRNWKTNICLSQSQNVLIYIICQRITNHRWESSLPPLPFFWVSRNFHIYLPWDCVEKWCFC